MKIGSLLYPVMLVACAFLLYSNLKKRRQYKRENIEILFALNEDDKGMRMVSNTMLLLIVVYFGLVLVDIVRFNRLFTAETLYVIILPFLFAILYIPLSKKTKVTTLGIIKRSNLIRWQEIKGIDYLKPDAKGKQKVRILFKGSYKDMQQEMSFAKDDEQLELFKNTAKEYRNNKKDKKIGKK